jgi:hypothetical protein
VLLRLVSLPHDSHNIFEKRARVRDGREQLLMRCIAITYPAECMSADNYLSFEGIFGRARMGLMNVNSCKDKNTIESQPCRISETSLATLWVSLVCWVHNVDYWEFVEGWYSYVFLLKCVREEGLMKDRIRGV